MVEIKRRQGTQEIQVKQESSDLPAARIEAALKYQDYLKNYKGPRPLAGCAGPLTQEEFVEVQTKIVGPLEELAELARKAINSKKVQ